MEKLNFKELNKLITILIELDNTFLRILQDEERQGEVVRDICDKLLAESAQASLAEIPISELANAKAGIRVSALQDAGYNNLGELAKAQDWELGSIDGIGEKQMEAIRNILQEFIRQLVKYKTIRLSAEEDSLQNHELIVAIAKYRQGQLVREDAGELQNQLHSFVEEILPQVLIRNRVRWLFASKTAKEATVQALAEMLAFFKSPGYTRVNHLIALYRDVENIDIFAAKEDFKRNSAEYYALLEKLGGTRLSKPVIYSSIPAQLAAEIDSLELNQQLFKGNLRSYQAFGAKYILFQKRVLLGDEMGLGKTIQAIAVMADLGAKDVKSHFLVICPASVLINWCREIKKFSAIATHLVHGPYLEDAFTKWQEEGGAAVTNYETMGKIVERIDNHMQLALLVIDEAHYIKNPDAKRTKYIRMLDNESERILMMTGTPLENRVDEMCSLIDFVRPDLSPEVRKSAYMSHVPEFRRMLAPIYLRRLREQVLEELPAMEEKQEWCGMTDADCVSYIDCLSQHSFAGMRRVSFLQDDLSTSSKAIRLRELCQEAGAEGRKILIYSFFRETVMKVSELMKNSCIGVITGNTEVAKRQALIDRFTDAPDGSVLVCQVQAGGTGLNMQTASVVIFCEPQIKPSLTNQALSRVYRMGQVRNVLVYHLLCENTVDEAMVRLLESKQQEFDAYAEESVMAEATENLMDGEWIQSFIVEENKRYLPMVVESR